MVRKWSTVPISLSYTTPLRWCCADPWGDAAVRHLQQHEGKQKATARRQRGAEGASRVGRAHKAQVCHAANLQLNSISCTRGLNASFLHEPLVHPVSILSVPIQTVR
jgi:hypothetical protein